jgi:hypothetical protein
MIGTSQYAPASFNFCSQGWVHFTVEWKEGRLILYPEGSWVQESPPQVLAPSDEEWKAFWSLADELGAWHWNEDFGQHIICGIPWSLEVEYDGRKIQCAGNGFERDAAPPGFKHLFQAMCRLIKWKTYFEETDA